MTAVGSHQVSNPAHRAGARRGLLLDAGFVIVLIGLTLLISVIGIQRSIELSVYDEFTHIDYVWQITHGTVPARGDVVDPQILSEWACRGQLLDILPKCGSPEVADPTNFTANGVNYNDFHPPLMYSIIAAIAGGIRAVADVNFITSARLADAILLAAGMALIYLAVRSWRVRRLAAASASTLLLCMPAFMVAGSTVTNDIINPFAGAAVIWLLGRVVVAGKAPIVSAALFMAVVAASKVIATMGLVAAAIVIAVVGVIRWRQGDRSLALRTLAIPVVMAAVLIVFYFGWDVFQSGRGEQDYVPSTIGVNSRPLDDTPWTEWFVSLPPSFALGAGYHLKPTVDGWGVEFTALVTTFLASTAAIAGIAAFRWKDPRFAAPATLLLGLILVPILVQVQTYLSGGMFFPMVSNRYGLNMAPLAVLVWALIIHRRKWDWGAAVFGGIGVTLTIVSMAGLEGFTA